MTTNALSETEDQRRSHLPVVEYRRYDRPYRVDEFLDEKGDAQAGPEWGLGVALPIGVVLDWRRSQRAGEVAEHLIVGEYRRVETTGDVRRYLDLAVSVEWIEGRTNYRMRDGRLVYVCPECETEGGKHLRRCSRG